MSWLTIPPNMNTFRHTFSEEIHTQDLTMLHYVWNSQIVLTKSYYATQCIKLSKSHNSYKFCGIKMVTKQTQLHVMTPNPTIYEQFHSQTDIDHYYVPMLRSGRGQKSSWHTTLREFYKELIKKKKKNPQTKLENAPFWYIWASLYF